MSCKPRTSPGPKWRAKKNPVLPEFRPNHVAKKYGPSIVHTLPDETSAHRMIRPIAKAGGVRRRRLIRRDDSRILSPNCRSWSTIDEKAPTGRHSFFIFLAMQDVARQSSTAALAVLFHSDRRMDRRINAWCGGTYCPSQTKDRPEKTSS
jgi:hypothetical protein